MTLGMRLRHNLPDNTFGRDQEYSQSRKSLCCAAVTLRTDMIKDPSNTRFHQRINHQNSRIERIGLVDAFDRNHNSLLRISPYFL